MSDVYKIGDKLRYKTWATVAPAYKVVAITPSGALYCQTQERRPYTRLIRPDELADYEKVPDEQHHGG